MDHNAVEGIRRKNEHLPGPGSGRFSVPSVGGLASDVQNAPDGWNSRGGIRRESWGR